MPELPEIQAHAERLTAQLSGRVLEGFEALSFTALKTSAPGPDVAVGSPLTEVGRRGKYLLLRFEPATFVVHLMQGGRLKPDPKASGRPRGALARWRFGADASDPPAGEAEGAGSEGEVPEESDALVLTEAGKEKRAGIWVVSGDLEAQAPLDRLGPDAATVTVDELAAALRATSVRLHTFLRDQHRIAGIGRRLSNEVCHRAGLSPFATTKKLDDGEVARLHEAIGSCIAESLAYERTRSDMSSSKDRPGSVHHRAGEPCPVCGDVIRTVSYARYTVAYCPTCQTGGRVLADNTTSKFLK